MAAARPARAFADYMKVAVAARPVEQFDTAVTLPQLEPDDEAYYGQPDHGVPTVDADGNPVSPSRRRRRRSRPGRRQRRRAAAGHAGAAPAASARYVGRRRLARPAAAAGAATGVRRRRASGSTSIGSTACSARKAAPAHGGDGNDGN